MAQEAVDLDVAENRVAEAVNLANDPSSHSRQRVQEWINHVEAFSELCTRIGVHSHIAVLGNALLAKSTNARLDVFSLKAGADHPGAFDARRTAEKVLVPAAQYHKFHLGVTGPQPLNNQPFFRHLRIESRMVVKENAQPLLEALIDLLQEVAQLREPEAIEALAGFIIVRRRYWPVYEQRTGTLNISSYNDLVSAVNDFVSRKSEGGGRAQAVAAGLLDATVGVKRVRLGKRNEPDRRVPGDVGLRGFEDDEAPFERVLEIRDKPVHEYTIQPVTVKAVQAGVRKVTLVAIANRQHPIDEAACKSAARAIGVDLEIYTSWATLIRSLTAWTPMGEVEWVEDAAKRIRERLQELEMPSTTITEWDALIVRV